MYRRFVLPGIAGLLVAACGTARSGPAPTAVPATPPAAATSAATPAPPTTVAAPTAAPLARAPTLLAEEPVVLVQIDEDVRAYPLQILIWHEIANDTVGGVPIAVTFCPLCNTAIVFERRVGDQVLDFGTTGMLRYSNLIMYDRQTESWWQQATGSGIAGAYAGAQLRFQLAPIIAWAQFAGTHPQGQVLSRETGFSRDYGRNPYAGYDDVNRSPFLYDGPATPDALPATARVLTVELGGEAVAYPYAVLEQAGAIHDTVGGQPIVVLWQVGTASALDASSVAGGRDVGTAAAYRREHAGRTLSFARAGEQLTDAQTGSSWDVLGRAVAGPLAGAQLEPVVAVNHFWFSWAAFKPATRIYRP